MRNIRHDGPLTPVDLRLSAWCDERGLTAVFDNYGLSSMALERMIDGQIYASALDTTGDRSPEVWKTRERQLRAIHGRLLEYHGVR